MKIEPFSIDEGWDLFSKVDFKEAEGGHVHEQIERISRQAIIFRLFCIFQYYERAVLWNWI